IDISAQLLIGFQENSGTFESVRSSPGNDMSVTSTLGTDGVIAVNDLGLDPVQAAADLPIDTAPPPLSQGCQLGGNGRFTNSERRGIPPSLDDPNSSDRGWEDIQPMDQSVNNSVNNNVHHVGAVDIWESNETGEDDQSLLDQMLGKGGWTINDQGEIEIVADTADTDPGSTEQICQLSGS
ncbi:MAG: hypothetical protein F6K16_40065, partial [Symploca sp. SIO2B6]|nr:hypothetical protein [Symploca sp. SIO2B6]